MRRPWAGTAPSEKQTTDTPAGEKPATKKGKPKK